jgi:hypothetical protein
MTDFLKTLLGASRNRDRLTRCGLLLNAVGGVLLLVCHFRFTLPSGDPQVFVDDYTYPWAGFWRWTNTAGSVAGAFLTGWGIYLQYRAIIRHDPPGCGDLP